ncbi:MAG: IS21 family transposase [Nitrospirota bacterium]
MYKWQQVKALKTQGASIKQIIKQLKLSKNTVRKYLRSSEPPRFKAREYEKLLNKYEETIKGMLEKHYIGTRIYNELLQMGYTGSLSSVHRYIADIKETEEFKAKATTRVETQPGKQMQYDWKEWQLPVDGKLVKTYIHEVVLSYSRKKYYVSSLSITAQDVIRAIAGAIEYFGGLAEEVVIDNPKQMVITHRKSGAVCYNEEFLRFCGLYGIQPNPCRNYRARTKGKVERPFYYLQEHLLRGLEVNDLSSLDGLLSEFTEKYNTRPHSDLKESPEERFLKEKGFLRRIPVVDPAILYDKPVRKVSNDGYISWDGTLYPIAMLHCLKDVRVEAEFGKKLRVYELAGELIAEHNIRLFDKKVRPAHPEHEEINSSYMQKKETYRAETVKKFIETFQQTGRFYIEGLKRTVTANMYWHIEEIMKYTTVYSTAEVSSALSECIEIGAYHKNSVRRLLQCKEPQKQPFNILNQPCVVASVDIRRPLADYKVEAAI